MLDLSNNNGTTHNFKAAYVKGGQRRIYLKRVEDPHFIDKTYATLKKEAEAAGFRVGAYDFLHPLSRTPSEVEKFFEAEIGQFHRGKDLRPCIDCEHGTPSPTVGVWIKEVARLLQKQYGVPPLIYGSGWYLEACDFGKAPGPLWLAAYGRNDGREYPIVKLPPPWKVLTAHQYTSDAHVIGISGRCDLSKVFIPNNIDVPVKKKK